MYKEDEEKLFEPEPNLEKILPELFETLQEVGHDTLRKWGITLFIGISDIMNTTTDKDTESLARHWIENAIKVFEEAGSYQLFFSKGQVGHA